MSCGDKAPPVAVLSPRFAAFTEGCISIRFWPLPAVSIWFMAGFEADKLYPMEDFCSMCKLANGSLDTGAELMAQAGFTVAAAVVTGRWLIGVADVNVGL